LGKPILSFNIFGAVLLLQRKFLLKDTGRKLSHLDRQFQVGQIEMRPRSKTRRNPDVSRDAFSFDPQDLRDEVALRKPHRSTAGAASSDQESRYKGHPDIPATRTQAGSGINSRPVHHSRNRTYSVRDSEFETLAEIGTFRVVAAGDLAQFRYQGDTGRHEARSPAPRAAAASI